MISNSNIQSWMLALGTVSTVLSDAKVREDWPCDEDADVEALITAISDRLDELKANGMLEALVNVDDETLLGLLAMFSFPRAVRVIQLIGERSSSKLTSVLDKKLSKDPQSAKYLNILYARIHYLSKTRLLFKLFNPERSVEITKGIVALASKQNPANKEGA